MNEFDKKAAEWDKSNMHLDRAMTVANEIIKDIPLTKGTKALEFGAGTGLLSFLLREHLQEITMIDNSDGMVKVLKEKLDAPDAENMRVMKINLENEDYKGDRVDLIYTLMVLHHVSDVETIISKFATMLNPGGHLAIADLYPEDGSFHGEGYTGYRGFDTGALSALLEKHGFTEISHRKVYVIDKEIADNARKEFDVFLMTATLHQQL